MKGDYCENFSSSKKTRVRTCGKDKERCTVIPVIASNGYLFPPIIIFKTQSKYYQNDEKLKIMIKIWLYLKLIKNGLIMRH